ncbi:MAG: hypothetical protein H6510_02675 [Acidobacteria bacterium]|nr:hypothetical protein [Acidobacteriota bacterium]MCB9396700.1 hypothetical protein [Acidobacteriota bacterium]
MILLFLLVLQSAPDSDPQVVRAEASKSWYTPGNEQLKRVEMPYVPKQKKRPEPVERESLNLPEGGFAGFSSIFIVLLVAVFVAGVLYLILQFKGANIASMPEQSRPSKTFRTHLLPESLQAEGDLLHLAKEARRRGDIAKAFALLYGYVLVELDAAHLIRLHPAKTNRMFLRELKEPRLSGFLGSLIESFEIHFFGPNPNDAQLWDQMLRNAERMNLPSEAPA